MPASPRYGEDRHAKAVQSAVANTYYATMTGAAADARVRAQASYTIASVFSGGLATVALVANFKQAPIGVRVGALGAIVCWLVAAAVYLWAVGRGPSEVSVDFDKYPDEFVETALKAATADRTRIEKNTRWGRRIALLAAASTLAVIALALLLPTGARPRPVRVALPADARNLVLQVCPRLPAVPSAVVSVPAAPANTVEVVFDQATCGQRVRVLLPATLVTLDP
ncbi:MAG TPA: hypothetical protein VFR67_27320 [Pilimelia sp.]|nr:hypothetical protein [Pilimelia sp.]